MKSITRIGGVVLFAIILGSCRNEDIYLANDANEVKYNKAFREMFGEIDPNQDFNMATQIQANISTKLGLDKEYDVKFYTANPRTDWDNAYLLGKFRVEDGGTANVKLDIPEYMHKIYVACVTSNHTRVVDEFEIKNGSVEVKFTAIGGIGSRSSVFPGGEKVEHSNGFAVTYGTHSTQNQWPLDWRDFIVIRGYGESMDGKFLEKNKINESDSKHVGYQIEYGYPSVKVEENKEYIHAPGTIYMDDLQNIWNLLNGNTVNDNTYNGDAKHGADQVEFVDYTTRPNILNDVLRLLGKESRPITEQTNNNPNFELLVKAADGPNANATLNLFPIFANKGFYDNVGIYYYKNEGTTEEGPHNANEIILFTTDPKTPADPNAVPKTPANPEAYDDNFHHIYQEFILWNTTAEDKGMGKSYWDITVPLKMEIGL